ncbi:MAG: hypothetical protein O2819_04520 [Planctomycetota bacterium]|nr:hypothetical protein [Planctomycetota bacterium]MDA1106520.1 hypothetical protein [Planctomycetota bacterium]
MLPDRPKKPPLSMHATMRRQQRGISDEAIHALLQHSDRYHAGDGALAYFMSKRAVQRARRFYGINLSEWANIALIMSPEGVVITVQHVARPKRSWRGKH